MKDGRCIDATVLFRVVLFRFVSLLAVKVLRLKLACFSVTFTGEYLSHDECDDERRRAEDRTRKRKKVVELCVFYE